MTTITLSKEFDYSKFGLIEGNRRISHASVEKIAQSMKEYGFLPSQHLTCFKKRSGELLVTDGQHRLKAAEKAEVAVYYMIDNKVTPEMCVLINSTHNRWQSEDYLNYWAIKGIHDYLTLDDFRKEYGFSLSNCIMILTLYAHGTKDFEKFQQGKFRVKDLGLSRRIGLNALDFKRYYDNYKKRYFIQALMVLTQHKKYKQSTMMKRMETQHERLLVWNSRAGYIENLLAIYNHRVLAKNRLTVKELD